MNGVASPRQATATSSEIAASHGKRIGILIVAYNAAGTLSQVLERIPEPVWSNIEEVAVFDDASHDATYELALNLKARTENTKLSVIRHSQNIGYGGNQKAGYQYFIQKGFDAVVLLHGDGQYAPEILATLYQPIAAGSADAVFGSRMMNTYGGALRGGMPLYKYVGNRILTAFENRALGMRLTEFHSGYRAYNLHALKQIDWSRMTDDFHFDTEIIIKLQHQGFRIAEVPIPTYYGDEICYVNGIAYAGNVFRAVRRYKQTVASVKSHPEFQEYFVKYALKTSSHSSHAYAIEHAPSGSDVLDLGGGDGLIAREFQVRGNRIWGVDSLEDPLHLEAYEHYIRADLDTVVELDPFVSGRQFDCVLLLDVLEHLRAPERLLSQSLRVLKDSGTLLVSLPNVANITVRLALLFGFFHYQERGILDRTHLRFYTRSTARRLLAEAGFEIVKEKMTVIPLERIFGPPGRNPALRLAHWILAGCTKLMPGLLGYQMFLVARKRPRENP